MHVQDYCIKLLAYEHVEQFMGLCLDNHNRLIVEETMSIGSINQTTVNPSDVVNSTINHYERSVVLVHNHPSEESKPSQSDFAVTRAIKKALTVMGITLHYHLIIADTKYVSLKSLSHC